MNESSNADHFAISVFKLNPDEEKTVLVHQFGACELNITDYVWYFLYILENFNVVFVVVDRAGGDTFVNICNEINQFKDILKDGKNLEKISRKLLNEGKIEPDEFIKFSREGYKDRRKTLEDLEGIRSAKTSYAKCETEVEFDPDKVSDQLIVGTIKKSGYTAVPIGN